MATIGEQIVDAFGIMLLGMGLVFVFLSVLIVIINLIALKYAPKPLADAPAEGMPIQGSTQIEPKVLAAISAAIYQYRTQSKNG